LSTSGKVKAEVLVKAVKKEACFPCPRCITQESGNEKDVNGITQSFTGK
jgi:hypothetical protein